MAPFALYFAGQTLYILKKLYEGISHNQEVCRKMGLYRDGVDSRPKACIHADHWSNIIIEDT